MDTRSPGELHRRSDPWTSVEAAYEIGLKARTQKLRLLVAYRTAGAAGLIAEEAGTRSGLNSHPLCCYWHRCTDLRDDGFIEPIKPRQTRKASSGKHQMVCAITDRGRAELLAEGL